MPDLNHRSKITVEDLLRLKRLERPDADFWVNFEQELRQKQLTALLNKRPWWQDLPQLLARRAYLPLGAAAILAFTIISVRQISPVAYAPAPVPVPEAAPRADRAAGETASVAAPASVPVNQAELPAHLVVLGGTDGSLADRAPASSTAIALASQAASGPREQSPSARSIAANLADLEQTEPELVNSMLVGHLSAPARVQPATMTLGGDLASVGNSPSKRTRLLAQYHEHSRSPEPAASESVHDRFVRHLGDSEISDRISRVGLDGSEFSLSLKF